MTTALKHSVEILQVVSSSCMFQNLQISGYVR